MVGCPIYERIESPYKLAQRTHKTRGPLQRGRWFLSLSLPPIDAGSSMSGRECMGDLETRWWWWWCIETFKGKSSKGTHTYIYFFLPAMWLEYDSKTKGWMDVGGAAVITVVDTTWAFVFVAAFYCGPALIPPWACIMLLLLPPRSLFLPSCSACFMIIRGHLQIASRASPPWS